MSHVFLTDDLEFNLDTYCHQDASLLCLIVRRALARAILNFERFSWVGLKLSPSRTGGRIRRLPSCRVVKPNQWTRLFAVGGDSGKDGPGS